MVDIRGAICVEALTWLGTPWTHGQCLQGPQGGVDCVHLPYGVARALGLIPPTIVLPHYSAEWHLHQNEELLMQILHDLGAIPLALAAYRPGDLLGFQYGRVVAHLAIAMPDDTVIHAHRASRRVVHQHFRGELLTRLRAAWAFPGVSA